MIPKYSICKKFYRFIQKVLCMKFCRETCCPNPVWLKFGNSNIFWTKLNWSGIKTFISSSFMPSIMIGAVACPGCNIEVLGWCPCLSCTHLYPNFNKFIDHSSKVDGCHPFFSKPHLIFPIPINAISQKFWQKLYSIIIKILTNFDFFFSSFFQHFDSINFVHY